jgi:hypothetical protein
MKIIKLVLIAALLTLTGVDIVKADSFSGKPALSQVINLSFDKAIRNPGLAATMHQQLNYHMMNPHAGPTWTARVTYQNVLYQITGTVEQWNDFFNWQRSTKKIVIIQY